MQDGTPTRVSHFHKRRNIYKNNVLFCKKVPNGNWKNNLNFRRMNFRKKQATVIEKTILNPMGWDAVFSKPLRLLYYTQYLQFQSTRPVWGATIGVVAGGHTRSSKTSKYAVAPAPSRPRRDSNDVSSETGANRS